MCLLSANKKHDDLLPLSTFVSNLLGLLILFQRHKSTLVVFDPHHFFPHKSTSVLVDGGLILLDHLHHGFPNDVTHGFLFGVECGHTL